VVCSLSLVGVPLFSGYLSKEFILEQSLAWAQWKYHASGNYFYYTIPVLSYATIAVTAAYMTRQIVMVFFGELKLKNVYAQLPEIIKKIPKNTILINLPLLVLGFFSLWFVFSADPLHGTSGWLYGFLAGNATQQHFSVIPLLLILAGAGIFLLRNYMRRNLKINASLLYNNWYFDKLYYYIFVVAGFRVAYLCHYTDKKLIDPLIHLLAVLNVVFAHLLSWTDRVFIDGTVNLIVHTAGLTGKFTRSFQSGKLQSYFLFAILVFMALILWIISRSAQLY
jgi:NADH-quinone oxidoreductase subunit L